MSEIALESVPIYEKVNLTIKEAAKVFNIGEHALRDLTKISRNDYTLKVGAKTLIRRKAFENYINNRTQL